MKAIHHRPRPDTPTTASLTDEWASLTAELGTTTDPGEQRLIRERIEQVEAEAARRLDWGRGRPNPCGVTNARPSAARHDF